MKSKKVFLLILFLILCCLPIILLISNRQSDFIKTTSNEKEEIVVQSTMPKIFPYSVIPGGIQTAEGFQKEVETDAFVKEHYKDFNFSKAYFLLSTGETFHASYRMNNKIYWTKNKVNIPKGEFLCSDGFYLIRARCGNRLAKIPLGAIHPREPNLEDEENINPSGGISNFKEPELVEVEIPKKEFEIEKESVQKNYLNTEIKEIFFEDERHFHDCKDCCDEPDKAKPPQPVPGPPSLLCLIIGLVGIVYFKRRK